MENQRKIRVKAMCLFMQDGFVLVADGASMMSNVRPVVPENFYRVLGGSMNFNETSEETIRREIREEVNMEIENLQLLDVIENKFVYAGEQGHEIVFLYKGEPAEKNMDKEKITHVIEDTYEFDMVWVLISDLLSGDKPLYPDFDYSKFLS